MIVRVAWLWSCQKRSIAELDFFVLEIRKAPSGSWPTLLTQNSDQLYTSCIDSRVTALSLSACYFLGPEHADHLRTTETVKQKPSTALHSFYRSRRPASESRADLLAPGHMYTETLTQGPGSDRSHGIQSAQATGRKAVLQAGESRSVLRRIRVMVLSTDFTSQPVFRRRQGGSEYAAVTSSTTSALQFSQPGQRQRGSSPAQSSIKLATLK